MGEAHANVSELVPIWYLRCWMKLYPSCLKIHSERSQVAAAWELDGGPDDGFR